VLRSNRTIDAGRRRNAPRLPRRLPPSCTTPAGLGAST
jgi:hypothetical protein